MKITNHYTPRSAVVGDFQQPTTSNAIQICWIRPYATVPCYRINNAIERGHV